MAPKQNGGRQDSPPEPANDEHFNENPVSEMKSNPEFINPEIMKKMSATQVLPVTFKQVSIKKFGADSQTMYDKNSKYKLVLNNISDGCQSKKETNKPDLDFEKYIEIFGTVQNLTNNRIKAAEFHDMVNLNNKTVPRYSSKKIKTIGTNAFNKTNERTTSTDFLSKT